MPARPRLHAAARRPAALAAASLLGLALVAGCSSSNDNSVVTGAAASSAAPTGAADAAPWQVIDCSAKSAPYGSDVSEGQLGTDDVQVTNIGGSPIVSVRAGAAPATELQVIDTIEGTGTEVEPASTVAVNYCGIGLATRTMFDSSYSRGAPATFPLDGVIPGFAEGLVGMRTGGQRLLVIPGALAYGPNPQEGSGIQPDETLIFVVDMVATQ